MKFKKLTLANKIALVGLLVSFFIGAVGLYYKSQKITNQKTGVKSSPGSTVIQSSGDKNIIGNTININQSKNAKAPERLPQTVAGLNFRPDLKVDAWFNISPPYFTISNDGPGIAEQLIIDLCTHFFKDGKIKKFIYGNEPKLQYKISELKPLTPPITFLFDEDWLNVNARLQKPLEHNIIEIRLTYRVPPDLNQKFQESTFYFINPEGRWVSENNSSLKPEIYNQMRHAVLEASKSLKTDYRHDPLHQIEPSR